MMTGSQKATRRNVKLFDRVFGNRCSGRWGSYTNKDSCGFYMDDDFTQVADRRVWDVSFSFIGGAIGLDAVLVCDRRFDHRYEQRDRLVPSRHRDFWLRG